jgi:hypothetical protein
MAMLRTCCAVVVMVSLALAAPLGAATLFQQLVHGTTTAVLTLSNLTSGSRSTAGATYDPRQGQTGLGYMHVVVECVLTFAAAPAPGTAVGIWFLKSLNGTNFEDTTTARPPDISCPANAAQAGTRVSVQTRLPAMRFQTVALNDATGQTITSGTINILPVTLQGN